MESAIIPLFKPFPWAPVDTVPANVSPGPDVTFSKTRYFSGCLVVRFSEGHKYSCISLIVVPASKQQYTAALTLSFRQPTLNSERNLKGKNIFHYLNPSKRQRCHMCYYRFHYKILFSSFWYQNYHTIAATMMLYTFCTCMSY